MPSWRRRSPSSTRSPPSARSWARTSRWSSQGMGLDKRIGVRLSGCRTRFRWLLLSQGRAGPGPHGIDQRVPSAAAPGGAGDQPRRAARGDPERPGRRWADWRTIAPVGVLGLAFKPNTDDLREAPALEIIHLLQSEGANVKAFDPVAGEAAAKMAPDLVTVQRPVRGGQGCRSA